jgi:hypothetical protein
LPIRRTLFDPDALTVNHSRLNQALAEDSREGRRRQRPLVEKSYDGGRLLSARGARPSHHRATD